MRMFDGRGLGVGLIMAVACSGAAWAAPGDLTVRVGAAHVAPNDDSGQLNPPIVAGAEVEVDSSTSLGLTVGYMLGEKLGIGLLAAWPFEHDIKGAGALAGAGTIAKTKHLPPTVTLQYHFAPEASVRPFVGAGINYTKFFSEKTEGALRDDLDVQDISLDDSWGWALEAGIDVDVTPDWFLSGQIFYIDIDTTAELAGGAASIDVDINPWVFMASVGRTF
ncbi:MAG: OmpW family outer membrane protein [Gammaproteobacteria bacterium]|nr:OmpW family outer membrane protein [Gammaproteobacteria bacterium]